MSLWSDLRERGGNRRFLVKGFNALFSDEVELLLSYLSTDVELAFYREVILTALCFDRNTWRNQGATAKGSLLSNFFRQVNLPEVIERCVDGVATTNRLEPTADGRTDTCRRCFSRGETNVSRRRML